MDIHIVTVGVEMVVEHQRSVHKRARVHQATAFLDDHAFQVEDENAIKDLVSESTLAAENHDLLVCDLVRIAHISRYPASLVAFCCSNLLPRVLLDVIYFDNINKALLIDSSTEREQVLVLEAAKSGARPRYIKWSNNLPFVLL